MLRALVVGILTLSACNGGSQAESHPVAITKKDAGTVIELAGKVTATNAGAARQLTVGNPVAADDVIDTGGDGSVVIELFHNNARWSLEAGIKSRVDESVAWGLPKQEVAQTVDHKTSAAGRHADRQAADTAVTATPDKVKPSGTAPMTPTPDHARDVDALQEGGNTAKDPPPPTKPKPPKSTVDAKRPKEPTSKPTGCDEVQCLIDPSGACCARYKKPADSKKAREKQPEQGDLPDAPNRQDISTAMQTVKPLILQCGKKHGVTGTIKLAFKISPDGSASSVTVKQTPDQKVDACVVDAGKAIVLPRSRNGITFTYPVIL